MMSILKTETEKELDALVAKNIMKWNVEEIGMDNIPDFSTNIEYAWKIVEHTGLLRQGNLYRDQSDWCIEIDNMIYRGRTAPMVICISALVEYSKMKGSSSQDYTIQGGSAR